MIVSKVTRVVNPHRRPVKRRSAARRRSNAGNPAHMLTLGFLNPKRSHTVKVARRKKSRNTRRAVRRSAAPRSNHRRRTKKRNPGTRIIVMRPKSNRRRRSSKNPMFFGSNVKAVKMAEYIAAGLVGLAVNKAVLPMLPQSLTGSNMMATLSSLGIALAEWYIGGMAGADIGAAVGFGALMNTGAQALNPILPQVGQYTGLAGYRGMGDFVPGKFAVPQNPVLDAGTGLPTSGALMSAAYPDAYGV